MTKKLWPVLNRKRKTKRAKRQRDASNAHDVDSGLFTKTTSPGTSETTKGISSSTVTNARKDFRTWPTTTNTWDVTKVSSTTVIIVVNHFLQKSVTRNIFSITNLRRPSKLKKRKHRIAIFCGCLKKNLLCPFQTSWVLLEFWSKFGFHFSAVLSVLCYSRRSVLCVTLDSLEKKTSRHKSAGKIVSTFLVAITKTRRDLFPNILCSLVLLLLLHLCLLSQFRKVVRQCQSSVHVRIVPICADSSDRISQPGLWNVNFLVNKHFSYYFR